MAKALKRRNSYDIVPGVSYDINIEEAAGGRLLATLNENGVRVYQASSVLLRPAAIKSNFITKDSMPT